MKETPLYPKGRGDSGSRVDSRYLNVDDCQQEWEETVNYGRSKPTDPSKTRYAKLDKDSIYL